MSEFALAEPPPGSMSLPALARRLSLHRATLNEMILQGRLRGERVNAHWYVAEEECQRLIATYRRPLNSRWPHRRAGDLSAGEAAVLAALLDIGPAKVDELAGHVDLHPGNIRKHLNSLAARGLAARDVGRVWRPLAEEPT